MLKLDLSNNQLDELPSAIAQLSALQYLDLSNNALKALLPEYGKLENLTHVNVSHNQITSLPVTNSHFFFFVLEILPDTFAYARRLFDDSRRLDSGAI